MPRWVLVIVVLATSCMRSSSVTCPDQAVCPAGTVCVMVDEPDERLCVLQDQLDACAGVADHVTCHTDEIANGRCYNGVCLAIVCGNGRVDVADPSVPGDTGEVCDDHNNSTGDGCSADCLSDETCGNGIVDGVRFEQCDDDNLVGHDGCDSRCLPEAPRWVPLSIDQIPGLSTTAMAYDSDRGQVVLFGGMFAATGNWSAQTWLWNGRGWLAAASPTVPVARGSHAMAYDASRHRVVMFGGVGPDGLLGDTWEWDGSTWQQPATPVSPSPRSGPAMTYDPRRKKIVVFGGHHQVGLNDFPIGETWEWDGSSWTQVMTNTTPPARSSTALAYDPVRGQVVMFGGAGFGTAVLGDTYTYDGTDWTLVPTTMAPGGRYGAKLGWDLTNQRLLLFGGSDALKTYDDTWTWNGTAWMPVTLATRPSPRVNFGMAPDASDRLVVLGGTLDDPPPTIAWNGSMWVDATPASPIPQLGNAVAFDDARGLAVMLDASGATTWESDGASWVAKTGGPSPVRGGCALAYDTKRAKSVLFGGQALSALDDTWLWDGQSWSLASPATKPSARRSAMAYDGAREQIVLFGGTPGQTTTPLDDTWVWDGTTWNERLPTHRPPPRVDHAIAYDPIRARIVIFGGAGNGTVLDDTWTWDGTDWTPVSTLHKPAARYGARLTWSSNRGRLVLVAGAGAGGAAYSDAWEWTGDDWSFIAAGNGPPPRSVPAVFPSRDRAALVMFGGAGPNPSGIPLRLGDSWALRWDNASSSESCFTTTDLDGDGLAGCADPDCAYACAHCGDGIRAALETCELCPSDYGTCPARCGDLSCEAGETACPGDCP